ncbi:MAG: glycosyltransferase family 4 protein [Bacteroidota bacterium]
MSVPEKYRKALCVLNFSGRYGGAEKRYATLFRYLIDQGSDHYLIINRSLFRKFLDNRLLVSDPRVIVFNDNTEKDANQEVRRATSGETSLLENRRTGWRLFFGRLKYFLKTMFMWMRFSVFFITGARKLGIKKLYGVWQGGIWTWMWCRFLGIKLIYSVNASEKLMLYPQWYKFFDSQYYVLKHAHVVDFLSPALLMTYQAEMGPLMKGKSVITPSSFVDTGLFFPQYPKQPKVVFLARMEALKNPRLFVDAVAALKKEELPRDAIFYMAGSGHLFSQIQEEAGDRGLDNIIFTGHQSRPWQLLRDASVFVSLQATENYPSQALMEAMACGCAIVATDVGETRRLVSEREGLLVKPSAAEVARAIKKLLNNPALCQELGRNASDKIRRAHTIEQFAGWYCSLMDEKVPSLQIILKNETIPTRPKPF